MPVGGASSDRLHVSPADTLAANWIAAAPGVALHGGPETARELPSIEDGTVPPQSGPLDRLVFARIPSSQSFYYPAENPVQPSGSTAILAAVSKGVEEGEAGYPGTLRIEVRFALQTGQPQQEQQQDVASAPMPTAAELGRSAGALRIEYRVGFVDHGSSSSSSAVAATPLNMTHHWAFNLSASDPAARAAENGTVHHHTLRMASTPGVTPPKGAPSRTDGQQLWTPELDDKLVPTGKLVVCEPGSPHDFLHPGSGSGGGTLGRTLMRADSPADGYDHFYAWGLSSPSAAAPSVATATAAAAGPRPRLVLAAPSTGLALAFHTNQAGVQVYATTGQPPAPAPAETSGGVRKTLHGGADDGKGNHAGSGVCLEFGAPHATLLYPQYQHLAQGDTILRRHGGEQYRSWVEAELFVKG